MKLIRFEYHGSISVGAIRGDSYIDLDALMESDPQSCINELGQRGSMRRFLSYCSTSDTSTNLEKAMASAATGPAAESMIRKTSECRLLAPIQDPGKIICLGLNYADHAAEQGQTPPVIPMIFSKFPSCIIGSGEPVLLPFAYTQKSDYEVELAVVIGRCGKEIPEGDAMRYVAGFTILNDVTARDFQSQDRQWVRSKNCDTFAPLGPHIATSDELNDPHDLQLELRLNGKVMQNSSTSQMIFKIPFLISYLSRCLTLEPGDIISTGTPPGVGVYRTPPIFLKAGDHMEAIIEKIGTLRNSVLEG